MSSTRTPVVLSLVVATALALAGCPQAPVQTPDPTPSPESAPLEEANVYLMLPADLTADDIDLASLVLGAAGELTIDDHGTVTVEAVHTGPAGPIRLDVVRGRIALGGLVSDLSAACDNGLDDDGDGEIDDADPDCFTSWDDDESQAGRQLRTPEEAGGMTGSVSAEGVMTLSEAWLPALTATLAGGGSVVATPVLRATMTGLLDPGEASATLTAPFALEVSCEGPACETSSCTVELSPWALATGPDGEYFPEDARLGAAGQATVVETDCPDALVAELGLVDQPLEVELEMFVQPPFQEMFTRLRVDSSTGTATLIRTHQDMLPPPVLPSMEEALATATQVLAALHIEPSDADVVPIRRTTDPDQDGVPEDVSWDVRYSSHLAVAVRDGAPLLGRVLGADVSVLIGDGGMVLGLENHWRPVQEFGTVPIRPASWAMEQIRSWLEPTLAEEGQVFDPETIELELGYRTGAGHHGGGGSANYLDPVWIAYLPDGEVLTSYPASDFRPRIDAVDVPPGDADGSSEVSMAVQISAGAPPYAIEWSSSINGPIGSGVSVEAWLSNGTHTIVVRVTDSNGAVGEAGVGIYVERSSVPEPSDEGRSFRFVASGTEAFTITANVPADEVFPKVSVVLPNGRFGSKYWFEEWRYQIKVDIDGTEYSLWSGKCVPGVWGATYGDGVGVDRACTRPQGTFEDEDGDVHGFTEITTFVKPSGTGDRGFAVGKLGVEYLPGSFHLEGHWAASGSIYGGPPGPPLSGLGGAQPGVTTRTTWGYKPPEGGIPCEQIVAFCKSNTGNEPVGGAPYCDIPAKLYDPSHPGYVEEDHICCDEEKYEVNDFHLYSTMAIMPRAGYDAWTTLIEDKPLPSGLINLNDWDGAKDCSRTQSFYHPGDTFCEVQPIARERFATVMYDGDSSGRWDNFHGKGTGGYWVVFPGANYDSTDSMPTVHYHPDWFDGSTSYEKNQSIYWYITRSHPSESWLGTKKGPADFVNGETLWPGTTNNVGVPITLWVHSVARTSLCNDSFGSLDPVQDNDNYPAGCKIFRTPQFFTW